MSLRIGCTRLNRRGFSITIEQRDASDTKDTLEFEDAGALELLRMWLKRGAATVDSPTFRRKILAVFRSPSQKNWSS